MGSVVTKPVTSERLAEALRMAAVDDGTPPDAPPRTWPLFDERVLSVLAEDIGDDGALDVAHLFLAESPGIHERLERSSIDSGGALLREVHTLASCARSVGLLRVGYLAGAIERAMANADPEPEQLAALQAMLRESVARLTIWDECTVAGGGYLTSIKSFKSAGRRNRRRPSSKSTTPVSRHARNCLFTLSRDDATRLLRSRCDSFISTRVPRGVGRP